MAKRHQDESDGNERLPGLKRSLIDRRTFLTVAGAGAFAGALGATGRSRAAEIDLGAEGLSPGDDIDPYLSEHFSSGNDVYVPPGEYRTEMEWWDTDVSDASIRGDPAGVQLRRPDGFWTDMRMSFDGHVVIENITFLGQLGHGRHRLRCDGQSGDAYLEFRNVNDPVGSIGSSDAIFMRAEGSGRIDYKWCYLESYPNSAFYQLENRPRMVFDGCTFRNTTNIHRGGSDGYTVRNCLYISDGDAPEFCENDNDSQLEDCASNGDEGGGLQRFFKFDQGYSWDGGTFENLHYYCEEVPSNGVWMDFQSESAGTAGTMTGLCVYNESDQNMFNFDGGHDWDVSDVHISGPGDTSTPGFFSGVVTGSDANTPPSSSPVWTPNGQGMPLVDSNADPDQPTPTPEEPTPEEPDGSVFEVLSTSSDAELDYLFVVDGTAERTATDDGVSSVGESNVAISENGDGTTEVTGTTGNGYGDAFEIHSEVTSFERTAGESDFQLVLDGQDVTDQFVGDGGDGGDTSPSTFEIVSTSPDAELGYSFVVDGTAEPADAGEGNSSIGESNDTVTDNGDGTVTVEGWTGLGYGDAFTVTGPISGFERTQGNSDFQLLLDGQDVTDQLADGGSSGDGSGGDSGPKRIYIDGTAAPEEVNEYRVEVSGELQADPENTNLVDGGLAWDALDDQVDGSTAVGVVGNGVDAYTFTGEVVDVTVKGNATSRVEE